MYTKDMIVGVDEVGRGAWAGPLVIGAVMLGGASVEGLRDSKLLTKAQRVQLDQEIRQHATAIGLGWVSSKHVDMLGMTAALKLATRRALQHIRHDISEIIIDGNIKFLDDPRVTTMKKADLLVPSVSAASIVAKVARDNYMKHMDTVFPGYAFGSHVGYGTAKHREAIASRGACAIHRLSYQPLKVHNKTKLTTKAIGDAAEFVTACYLEERGHQIIARNWRTKYCEIDIVSQKDNVWYFTEVKYRKTDAQGGGFAAITPRKRQQMALSAKLFASRHSLVGDLRLAAADATGTPPRVVSWLELG